MTLCPQCNHNNRPGVTFCAHCGFPLLSCPRCNASMRSGALFCQRCGQAIVAAGTVVCTVCQTANRPQAKFCSQCRQPLTASDPFVACPICGQTNKPESRFCRRCGSPMVVEAPIPCFQCGHGLRPGAHFCPQCGQLQKQQTPIRYETGKLPPQSAVTDGNGETYLISSLIAKGGMGAVYKAVRPSDQTVWAIKEMSESVVDSKDWDQALAAFYEEARLLQTLAHDNLPAVIDVFEDRHRHYMVMDFIDGHTLTELMSQAGGTLTAGEVVEWGKQLCLVLDYLHKHNPPIIYRDLKPDNVMVETGTKRVKLIDFGIARRFKGGKKSDTVHLGTSGYAAPEQYGKSGRESDASTDIYALGATLHHLLTGLDPSQNPFNFPDIQSHAKVSADVAAAITRAVKLRPEQRYQSAAEMYEMLAGKPLPAPVKVKPKPIQTAAPKAPVKSSRSAVSMPVLHTTFLQADSVVKGSTEILALPVKVQSGALDVSAGAGWLTVSPEVVDRNTKEIEITADTSRMSLEFRKRDVTYQPDSLWGRVWWLLLWLTYAHARYLVPHAAVHQTTVHVGQEKAEVQIEVVPSTARTRIGWILSSMAVTVELTGLGWAIWILLMGM